MKSWRKLIACGESRGRKRGRSVFHPGCKGAIAKLHAPPEREMPLKKGFKKMADHEW